MRDDETLADVLAVLDEAEPAQTPAYTARLWEDVKSTLERTSADEPRASVDVVDLRRRTMPMPQGRGGRVALVVGAAVAAIVAVVALSVDRTTVETEERPPAATPVPLTAAQTCSAYADSGDSLDELEARLEAGTARTTDIDGAAAALEQLRRDLASTGEYTTAELGPFDVATALLGQAALELDAGNTSAAAATLETIRERLASLTVPVAEGEILREPCVPTNANSISPGQ